MLHLLKANSYGVPWSFQPLEKFLFFWITKIKKNYINVTKVYQVGESKNSKVPFHCSGRRHVLLELLMVASLKFAKEDKNKLACIY